MSISFLPPDWRDRLNKHRQGPRPLWMRIAAWVWAGFAIATLLAVCTVTILVNNPRFHRYILRTMESNASESLGVRVQLQNFALHLPTLSVDLYGISVDAASSYPNPPILQVDHIEAGVRVVSMLHRAWYFDSLRIDRPIAHIFVDDHGVSNIPTPKSSGNSPTIFDPGIRHALLDHGEVYYNDKPSALAVDLRDVEFRSSFNSLLKKYSGKLTYSDGRLVYGTFQPLTHNLEAQFEATPTTFDITQSKLTIGASQIVLTATLRNYSSPSVQAHYDVTVDGSQMATLLHDPSLPAGTIQTSGSLHYEQTANRSTFETLVVNGNLASRRLDIRTSTVRTGIANVAGQYSLANGDVTLRDFRANLLGGEVKAQGTMKN